MTTAGRTRSTRRRHGAPDTSWIMWAGSIDLFGSLEPRFRAAADHGCEWVSVSILDVRRAEAGGGGAADIARQASDLGLRLVLDPLMGWLPGTDPGVSPFAGFGVAEVLHAAEQLGAELISAVAGGGTRIDPEAALESFRGICDEAARFGARVQLEFIPWTAVPDLETAWEIVRRAERDNGGILVDAWHFYRGVPDLDLLSRIPGDRVFSVQLDDGQMYPGAGTREQSFHRDLPGEGEFDLSALISTLDAIGGLGLVGPEVIGSRAAELDAAGAADLIMTTTMDAFATATAHDPARDARADGPRRER